MDEQYWTFVLSRIFVPFRLIARNFADNRCTEILPIFPLEISEYWRNSEKFDIITFAQCCKTTNCHYRWKRIGNVSQVVWSTASFVSLIIHSTGWEDNSKFMNTRIAAASDVLVCYPPGLLVCLFVFGFFTHSCVNKCTELSRVKTELTVKEDKCCCPYIRDIYITVLAPVD